MDAPPDFDLFPPLEPRRSGTLAVGEPHTLYWEEAGAPDGIPVVYLHGGPGAGASPRKRQWFDPDAYRIVLMDQRGAMRSTPLAEVRENTMQRLVEDIEALRRHLGVERWLVAGGSWGTTLSLADGLAHPDACLGFILRGVVLGSASEIDWVVRGIRRFRPRAHEELVEWLPDGERDDVLEAYARRLFGDDEVQRRKAAKRWYKYSEDCALLVPDPQARRRDRPEAGEGRAPPRRPRRSPVAAQDPAMRRNRRAASITASRDSSGRITRWCISGLSAVRADTGTRRPASSQGCASGNRASARPRPCSAASSTRS